MQTAVPDIFADKRFDRLFSGQTDEMSQSNETKTNETKKSSQTRELFDGQEDPVPTTETLNGEIVMDPNDVAPARKASEHLDILDSAAGRSSVTSPSEGEGLAIDHAAVLDAPEIDDTEEVEAGD